MQAIQSFEEYKAIITPWKKSFGNNNSYFPTALKKFIVEGKVQVEDTADFLCLLVDEGKFYQLVVYWNEDVTEVSGSLDGIRDLDKPVVCNIVKNSMDDEAAEQLEQLVERFGLQCEAVNYEYQMHYEPGEQEKSSFSLRNAKVEEQKEILRLWESSLPYYVVSDISREEWEKMVNGGWVRVICDEQDHLYGAVYFDAILGKSTVHHVTVKPEGQGKGLGYQLLVEWIRAACEKGAKTFLAWIEENNVASIRMHQKCGAQKTGKVSLQYVWKNASQN